MGSSGAFGGSGGKDANDLRDSIADWLDDHSLSQSADDSRAAEGAPDGQDPANDPNRVRPNIDLRSALGILLRTRGGSGDGPGGIGGGARGGGVGGVRSSGGAQRSVGRVSRSTGRAGRLALAYSAGDRQSLAQAGLDYDQLRALGNPVEIGFRIIEAAFETQPDSTIEDSEAREIAATVVEWVLSESTAPTPDEVVRKAIESIIVNVVLTEVGHTIRTSGASQLERQATEGAIRDAAEVWAQQVSLGPTGATDREMSTAIESGIRELGQIFGVDS